VLTRRSSDLDDILGKFLHVLSVSSCTATRGCPPSPSCQRRFSADGASGAEAGGGTLGADAVLRRGVDGRLAEDPGAAVDDHGLTGGDSRQLLVDIDVHELSG